MLSELKSQGRVQRVCLGKGLPCLSSSEKANPLNLVVNLDNDEFDDYKFDRI